MSSPPRDLGDRFERDEKMLAPCLSTETLNYLGTEAQNRLTGNHGNASERRRHGVVSVTVIICCCTNCQRFYLRCNIIGYEFLFHRVRKTAE